MLGLAIPASSLAEDPKQAFAIIKAVGHDPDCYELYIPLSSGGKERDDDYVVLYVPNGWCEEDTFPMKYWEPSDEVPITSVSWLHLGQPWTAYQMSVVEEAYNQGNARLVSRYRSLAEMTIPGQTPGRLMQCELGVWRRALDGFDPAKWRYSVEEDSTSYRVVLDPSFDECIGVDRSPGEPVIITEFSNAIVVNKRAESE